MATERSGTRSQTVFFSLLFLGAVLVMLVSVRCHRPAPGLTSADGAEGLSMTYVARYNGLFVVDIVPPPDVKATEFGVFVRTSRVVASEGITGSAPSSAATTQNEGEWRALLLGTGKVVDVKRIQVACEYRVDGATARLCLWAQMDYGRDGRAGSVQADRSEDIQLKNAVGGTWVSYGQQHPSWKDGELELGEVSFLLQGARATNVIVLRKLR